MRILHEKKWLLVLAAAVLVVLAVVAIILAGRGGNGQPEDAETTLSDEAIWGTAPEETPGIAVDTPHMTFYYPEEWREQVEIKQSGDGDNSVTTFWTEISGKDVELFSVILSPEEEDGYLLGRLRDKTSGMIHVYTVINEIGSDGWTEEEYAEICALQERVNDIIVQFYEDERFEPSR